MVSINDLNRWVYDAQKTLIQGQGICSEAESKLQVNDADISHRLPRRIAYISNLFTTIKEHQKKCTYLVDKCLDMHQKGLEKVDTGSLETLMMIISQLRATKVPEFVVSGSSGSSIGGAGGGSLRNGFNLSDFISMESIDLLKQNVDGYNTNFQKITLLLGDQYMDLIQTPLTAISKKYTKLLKSYNDIMYEVNNRNSTSNTLRQILKENSSLEGEMATILEQLTNHYDQVFRLREETVNNSRAVTGAVDGDYSVLENDALELPEVSNELQNIYDIIVHNSNRASELCSNRFHLLATIEFELEKQIESYKEFKDSNIIKFVTLWEKCSSHINEVETPQAQADVATIEQLIYHYKQFLLVYKHNFYLELHYEKYAYPRKFLAKLKKFLNEELDEILKHERERRKNWLEKYGDFIPKEFQLPGESEQPYVVQVITEGLDEIGGNKDAEIERKILDLISTGNI